MTRPVTRALLSVSDKTGLVEFAGRLVAAGVEIVSSGGTAAALVDAGVPVVRVADVTGAPEILGGRLKTLHPQIHGGILADLDEPGHIDDLGEQGIEPFQLVVVNLYPFEATVADPDVTEADAVEQIDIGGPAMVRAAAKNHAFVGVVTTPDDYGEVAFAVESGGLDEPLRRRLAADAFAHTAAYDAGIVAWLGRNEPLPSRLTLTLDRVEALRYGENPHQGAALYVEHGGNPWWRQARLLQGKPMSFNNYADTEAAWRLVDDLPRPAAVIVKHTNACGAAMGADPGEAFAKAWDCDPLSAFGGDVAVDATLDAVTSDRIAATY
jgi:phosphoribosylaminoimidazolecarboxamide formyltransferase/IMP cyclohydrolase